MNDKSYSNAVKDALYSSVDNLCAIKDLFLKNPGRDFSRKRLIDFESFIKCCLQMEGHSVQNELLNYYSHPIDGAANLENTPFLLYLVPLFLDLAAYMRYNYYVSYVNRKDLI